nr:hypothetical protein [uncultured Cohaesibacter sp.]
MISPNRSIKIGKKTLKIPESPLYRKLLGSVLILGGLLGFLPILGFWMLPLGLLILSIDLPLLRKYRRKLMVKMEKRNRLKALTASTQQE